MSASWIDETGHRAIRRRDYYRQLVHAGQTDGSGHLRHDYPRNSGENPSALWHNGLSDLGHRLRTRAGHCIQCKPTNIAFQGREDTPGYVYIAGSLSGRVIKIGTTGDLNQRENQMRAEGYGGAKDWIVLFSVYVSKGGEFERAASSRVKGNRVYRTYFKDGIEQGAVELHLCSFSEALRAMTEHLSDEERKRLTAFRSNHTHRYEFEYE